MLSCFAPLSIREKFDANRFTCQKSKKIDISWKDTATQKINLVNLNSKYFSK